MNGGGGGGGGGGDVPYSGGYRVLVDRWRIADESGDGSIREGVASFVKDHVVYDFRRFSEGIV